MRLRNVPRREPGGDGIAAVLAYGEFVLNAVVAVALGVGGFVLFAAVGYEFVRGLGHGPVIDRVIELLSGLLLVFIFTELIGTLRVVIATREVRAEPFLVVGIVASIRRVIVIGAEAESVRGTARFRDVLLEIGILTGTVLVLGVTLYLLRRVPARAQAVNHNGDGDGPPSARRPAK